MQQSVTDMSLGIIPVEKVINKWESKIKKPDEQVTNNSLSAKEIEKAADDHN